MDDDVEMSTDIGDSGSSDISDDSSSDFDDSYDDDDDIDTDDIDEDVSDEELDDTDADTDELDEIDEDVSDEEFDDIDADSDELDEIDEDVSDEEFDYTDADSDELEEIDEDVSDEELDDTDANTDELNEVDEDVSDDEFSDTDTDTEEPEMTEDTDDTAADDEADTVEDTVDTNTENPKMAEKTNEANDFNETQPKHGFKDWVNPHNYDEDGHYIGEKQDFGYKQHIDSQEVDTSTYKDYVEQQAVSSVSEYMNKYGYVRDDFATYSQDPEWRNLMRKEYPDYELPELTQENAKAQLSDYMNSHNYGQDDIDTYSQDPVWRELQSAAYPDYEMPPFKETPSNSEIKDALESSGAVKNADLRDFDPEFSKSFNDAVTDAKKDFPDLEINYCGTIQNQVEGIRQAISNDYEQALRAKNGDKFTDEQYRHAADVYADNIIKKNGLDNTDSAFAWSLNIPNSKLAKYNGIAVNEKFASDNAFFNEQKVREVQTKHKPIGCDTSKATVDHELGHEIDRLVDANKDSYINNLYNEMISNGNAKDTLSTYSATNVKEFIAEAYSEYRNNPNPRDYSTKVYNRLKELYSQRRR